MNVDITVVASKAELKKFIGFTRTLYAGNQYWVPPLIKDEMDTLTPGRNPAFENAEARLFLARRDGRIVGRIAGILSHAANDKYGTHNMRFGWFDAIDDYDVAKALLDTVEAWGREKGMTTLTGPHGFTDLDQEGLLIEGFNELATMAELYNHPYYQGFLERYGFVKEVDYVEYQALSPEGTVIPEKMTKMLAWAQKRNNFRLVHYTSIKTLRKERGQQLFDLLDETFAELYGTIPLTQKQKDYYIDRYLPFANPEYIKIAVDDTGKMIGFMLAIPSLSKAFQKAKGHLFPFGFIHILRALKRYDTLDFMMAGIVKPYRGKGVDLMMVVDIFRSALAHGVHFAESNPELETNSKIQGEWKIVDRRQHKRRRIYTKSLS
jgi:GNAT superfamily N-acetyltransferase